MGPGDFDGDGFDDLALGEPDMSASGGGRDFTGRVEVYYGSADGISSRYPLFSQDTPGIGGTPERLDHFGEKLDSGEVNGDGFDDLVIGAYGDKVLGRHTAGSVVLVYGSATGLDASGSLRFAQNHVGVPGSVRRWAAFGSAVAIEDVTGDGFASVAISNNGGLDQLVSVFPGSRNGMQLT